MSKWNAMDTMFCALLISCVVFLWIGFYLGRTTGPVQGPTLQLVHNNGMVLKEGSVKSDIIVMPITDANDVPDIWPKYRLRAYVRQNQKYSNYHWHETIELTSKPFVFTLDEFSGEVKGCHIYRLH